MGLIKNEKKSSAATMTVFMVVLSSFSIPVCLLRFVARCWCQCFVVSCFSSRHFRT